MAEFHPQPKLCFSIPVFSVFMQKLHTMCDLPQSQIYLVQKTALFMSKQLFPCPFLLFPQIVYEIRFIAYPEIVIVYLLGDFINIIFLPLIKAHKTGLYLSLKVVTQNIFHVFFPKCQLVSHILEILVYHLGREEVNFYLIQASLILFKNIRQIINKAGILLFEMAVNQHFTASFDAFIILFPNFKKGEFIKAHRYPFKKIQQFQRRSVNGPVQHTGKFRHFFNGNPADHPLFPFLRIFEFCALKLLIKLLIKYLFRSYPHNFILPIVNKTDDIGLLGTARFFPSQCPSDHLRHQNFGNGGAGQESRLYLGQVYSLCDNLNIYQNLCLTVAESVNPGFVIVLARDHQIRFNVAIIEHIVQQFRMISVQSEHKRLAVFFPVFKIVLDNLPVTSRVLGNLCFQSSGQIESSDSVEIIISQVQIVLSLPLRFNFLKNRLRENASGYQSA